MKSLEILHSLLIEASDNLKANTKRDWITIQNRFKHEGKEFLTLTLPAFNQWFERSIERGQVGPSIFYLFKKKAGGKSVLPCFLHGLTSLVFDSKVGLIREDKDVNAVLFIRQLCLFHKKMKEPSKPERIAKALESYIETDVGLRKLRLPRGEPLYDVQTIVRELSPKLRFEYRNATAFVLPKHGPGGTVERLSPNSKFKGRDFYERWQGIFSWEELYGFSTIHQAGGAMIRPRDETPVRVSAVPKTGKGPRIISVEPVAMQYAQQLVSIRLREALVKSGINRQLNLTDQTINRRLAESGSKTGYYATLDLSEASDRLHCKVVSICLGGLDNRLARHIFACRSSRAKIGKSLTINLVKFASMGSALTFPVESYCFYILCVAAVYRGLIHELSIRGKGFSSLAIAQSAMKQVFVFGDDIIIPGRFGEIVSRYLELFGLKVNRDKSFFNGLFRESCGFDGFQGYDVSPVYLRRDAPSSIRDATALVSWVSMGNQFHIRGFWRTAEAVRRFVDKIYKFPMVNPRSKALGWHHYTGAYQPERWSKNSSSWKVTSLVSSSSKPSDRLDEYDALLKHQISLKFPEDSDHLSRSTERFSLKLRPKTVQPY